MTSHRIRTRRRRQRQKLAKLELLARRAEALLWVRRLLARIAEADDLLTAREPPEDMETLCGAHDVPFFGHPNADVVRTEHPPTGGHAPRHRVEGEEAARLTAQSAQTVAESEAQNPSSFQSSPETSPPPACPPCAGGGTYRAEVDRG